LVGEAPAAFSITSISLLPPRNLRPLTSSGLITGLAREAMPPACQTQVMILTPFSSTMRVSSLPIGASFQRRPWS
jgi:hypothetical protein